MAVEALLKDRGDALVALGAESNGPIAGPLEPGSVVALSEVEDAEASPVAVLRMRAILKLMSDDGVGVRTVSAYESPSEIF